MAEKAGEDEYMLSDKEIRDAAKVLDRNEIVSAHKKFKFATADSDGNRSPFRFQIALDSEMKSPTIPR